MAITKLMQASVRVYAHSCMLTHCACSHTNAHAGPMYQAGTLSGNPLAMTAGIKVRTINAHVCAP